MVRTPRLVPVVLLASCACPHPPAAAPAQPEEQELSPASPYASPAAGGSPSAPPGAHTEGPPPVAPPGPERIDSGDYRNLEEALSDLTARQGELDEVFEDRPAEALGQDATACRRACYALASMARAVAGVCELAGEDDDRCRDARALLARSEQRVGGSGCGCS